MILGSEVPCTKKIIKTKKLLLLMSKSLLCDSGLIF